MSEDVHDSNNGDYGPRFTVHCPYAHCAQFFKGYTQKGVDALMSMHCDDHKRGIVANSMAKKLTPEDRAFLKEARIGWEDDVT
jgi:hypothetical protein